MTISFAILACLVLAAKADAKVCGDLTGVQCRASAVFDLFRSGYLLATTGKAPKYAAPPYIKRVSGFGPGYVRLFFQTDSYQETCAIGLTGRLDNFVVSCRSDPSTLHTLRVPFADYKNCYVVQHGKYNSGCRLVVNDNASPRAVSRCLDGLARVCPGQMYTTWDQRCVRGCTYSSDFHPWGFGQEQQMQEIQQQLVE